MKECTFKAATALLYWIQINLCFQWIERVLALKDYQFCYVNVHGFLRTRFQQKITCGLRIFLIALLSQNCHGIYDQQNVSSMTNYNIGQLLRIKLQQGSKVLLNDTAWTSIKSVGFTKHVQGSRAGCSKQRRVPTVGLRPRCSTNICHHVD